MAKQLGPRARPEELAAVRAGGRARRDGEAHRARPLSAWLPCGDRTGGRAVGQTRLRGCSIAPATAGRRTPPAAASTASRPRARGVPMLKRSQLSPPSPKVGPVAGGDAGLALDAGGELGRRHAGAGEVDPGEIGRLHRHRAQPGDGADAVVEQPGVSGEIGAERVEPGVALVVGGGRHQRAEAVGRGARARDAPRRSAGAAPSSGMMTLPVSAPAMLKVLVVAVSITSRSSDLGRGERHRHVRRRRAGRGRGGSRRRPAAGRGAAQKSASARSSARLQTRPPGLCGEQSTTHALAPGQRRAPAPSRSMRVAAVALDQRRLRGSGGGWRFRMRWKAW